MSGARAGYDAVVLAGGAARRLGGVDKAELRVGGVRLLDRALEACAAAGRTVVVGPRRETQRAVEWVREEPPGGGPLAGLAAGVARTAAELVVVLAADLPFVTPQTVSGLVGGVPAACDGALLVDAGGRDQPLLAVYRGAALRRELAALAAEHGTLDGLPLRLLTGRLELARPADPGGEATFDTDTWEALAAARARIREHGRVLDEWIAAVKADLGIELDVDTATLLDLARDAAHGVARPAAPLTTFLVGYAAGQAAGQAGGGGEAVAEAVSKAAALARRWEAETAPDGAAAPTPAPAGTPDRATPDPGTANPGTADAGGFADGDGDSAR